MAGYSTWGDAPSEDVDSTSTLSTWGDAPAGEAAPSQVDPNTYESFKAQYLADAAKPTTVWDATKAVAGGAANLAGSMAKTLYTVPRDVVAGLSGVAGKATDSETPIKTALGDTAQSAVNGIANIGYDAANAARQAGSWAKDQWTQSDEFMKAHPNGLKPGEPLPAPTEQEIKNAYERKITNDAFAKERQSPVIAQNLGEDNPDLTKAVTDAPNFLGAAAVGRGVLAKAALTPLGDFASNANHVIGDTLTGAIKGAPRLIIPKPFVENAVDALNPKASAFNPSKHVQAVKDATAAVQRVGHEFTPQEWAHPQTLADAATDRLQQIQAQREALSGKPVAISLDPLADAIGKIANDKVTQIKFPDQIEKLKLMAENMRGHVINGAEAEKLNQFFNAENQSFYSKTNIDKASASKAHPELMANLEASKALRAQMDKYFGPEFGELGKDYGATRQIADLAQRQAVRQSVLENRVNLYEGLTWMQAIQASGKPLNAAYAIGAGQVLKYAGSPVAKFQQTARRLATLQKSP